MKILFKAFSYLILLVSLSILTEAKEFQGINPMQSTRSEVNRILGKPKTPIKNWAFYYLKEGNVQVYYTNLINDVQKDCKLPDNVVFLITFEPKPQIPLSDLKLDLTIYKKFDPTIPKTSRYQGYINKDEGLAIITLYGNIKQADYFPDAENQKFCPNWYESLGSARIILN